MKNERIRIYSWEFPIRLTHWINFLCILILSVTGYYISDPFIHALSSKQYIMGWIRFVHFVAAYTFLMSIIIRLYWSLVGNKYACFKNWFPFSARRLGEMADDVKCYLLIGDRAKCHPGHTALGSLTYLFLMLIFFFMIFSGFAMYSVNHAGAVWTILGGWLLNVMTLQTARLYHHAAMYVILVIAMIHVYISWFSDSRDRNGLMGSIFTGYKFVTEKDLD